MRIIEQNTTTLGHDFKILESEKELIYIDCFGDSLTWDNTNENKSLIYSMIDVITTKEPIKRRPF
jgi:hypothetical protein